ncbi:MAG: hypothetical protein JNL54_13370 [Kineosporiaceae bacterium]|nr:hypothetical protein [Kineosporiaceae bacterium]
MNSFDRLRADAVHATVERLERRIAARFPDRGLREVAAQLGRLAAESADVASAIQGRVRTIRALARVLSAIIVAATAALLVVAFADAEGLRNGQAFQWVPLVESTINDLVFAAAALFFLHAWPQRLERGHLLGLLHRLRSLAHIIDMHQLTKDPERLRPDFETTAATVEADLDRAHMEYYLDYCSELLSLVGKVAALCAEKSQDPLVLNTVSDLEDLTNGMARKIWQKISLLPS